MRILFLLLLVLPATYSSFAQTASVLVGDIEETRDADATKSKLVIDLKIMGLDVSAERQVRLGAVTATTDSGITLDRIESPFGEGYEKRPKLELTLKAAPRGVSKITSLRGTLLVHAPTEANGGLVVIRKPITHLGKNLLPASYTDLKIIYHTTASRKAMIEAERAAEQKRDEARLDSLRQSGAVGEELADMAIQLKQGFQALGDAFTGGGDGKKAWFKVEGDYDRIVHIVVKDTDGKALTGFVGRGGNWANLRLKEPMQDDWRIELYLENDAAVEKIPFSLTDIVLP